MSVIKEGNKRKTSRRKHKSDTHDGRGVVYIAHLPHGFYEEQLQDYCRQFGYVTAVKVARSSKTGRSKGYAFVEFKYADVAKVVAETMHNYLMFNKLLKTKFIPAEKLNPRTFWRSNTEQMYKRAVNRANLLNVLNGKLSAKQVEAGVRRRHRKLEAVLAQLSSRGISHMFQPVEHIPASKAAPSTEERTPILLLDESDDDVVFRVPKYVKIMKRRRRQKACSSEKEQPLKSPQ